MSNEQAVKVCHKPVLHQLRQVTRVLPGTGVCVILIGACRMLTQAVEHAVTTCKSMLIQFATYNALCCCLSISQQAQRAGLDIHTVYELRSHSLRIR